MTGVDYREMSASDLLRVYKASGLPWVVPEAKLEEMAQVLERAEKASEAVEIWRARYERRAELANEMALQVCYMCWGLAVLTFALGVAS